MSTITSSNGGGNSYWRSAAAQGAGAGSLSSGNHSPLSSNSSSSSLSSNGGGGTTVHVKNYANGLLSPVTNSSNSRYQSPYSSQSQSQPSPLPRTINATPSSTNYNTSSSKYINNSGTNSSHARSVGLYSSSYDGEQRGGGMSKSQYHNGSSGSNGLRKVNHAHASSNEINVTVNNTSSPNKYYSNHSNGIVSAVGGGNYYGPGTERDKYNSSSSASASSSGGVSVLVGRSSSYNQINTLGTTRGSNGNGPSHGYNNNYYVNNGQSNNQNGGVNGLSHHHQQDQYHRFSSQQQQQQQQRQRMSNGFSVNTSQANTSLNGTVAVAVVGRSLSQSKQSETSSNSYNGRYGSGLGGSSANTRQISVGSSGQQQQGQHRPAQRTSSFPNGSAVTGTNGITIGDVSVFSAGKKMVLNGSSNSVTMNSNNAAARKKGILRKDAHKKKMSVTFPKEVCQVIGFGGDTTDDESDEETVPDPLDSASVTELLEKSSSTPLERELNRLTTKNTSFNSIKTNLLGYTSIEIGPIVGCTNGNSLTGPSKPLISIGTFETRGQPLKIKKFGSDSNEEREQQQKSISNGNKRQDEVKPAIVKVNGTTLPANNSRMTSTSVTATASVTKTTSAPVNQKPTSTPNGVPIPASRQSLLNKDNKLKSISNANAPDTGKANLNSSGQTKANDNSNTNKIIKSNENTTLAGNSISSVSVNQENTTKLNSIATTTTTVSSSPEKSTQRTVTVNEPAEKSNIQVLDDDDTYNAEPPPIPVEPIPTKSASTSLSNLYILNDGNIASKRSTFLHDILSFDTPISLDSQDGEDGDGPGVHDSLEPPRVVKSEPKLDSPVRVSPVMPNVDESLHHFDDSLEDSGLDIKTTKLKLQDTKRSLGETSSESDNEKSGSNSDSGTEHDFMERNRNKTNLDNSKDGLFISVEESSTGRELLSSKASKLSPDSVLSEMSTTESSESLNRDDDDDDDVPPLEVVPPINSNGLLTSGPAIPPVLKRLAPAPPKPQDSQSVADSFYTNTKEEELYDDVTTLQDKSDKKEEFATEYTDEDIEEILYDDCTILGQVPPPPPSEKKGSCGSYDFTDTNNKTGLLDPDVHEKIPLKPDDGIEFIGIRKIDAESFLKENSPPPAAGPSTKKNRVGLGSPKPAKRRVNQFFSTIGKKAGAAFNRAPLDFTSISKSTTSPQSPVDVAAASFAHFSKFKRSLSQDEVNLTRTQEIYATLSPSMLKNKGLAPVLSKLSKLDFPNPKDKDEDKLSRKNKFSSSLKKFLKFGSKESDGKYDFGAGPDKPTSSSLKTDIRQDFSGLKSGRKASSSNGLDNYNESNISNSPRHSSVSHLEEISSNNQGKYYVGPTLQRQNSNDPSYGQSGQSPMRPPPPPPRVYSCDQLNGYLPQQQYGHTFNNGQSGSGSGSVTGTHGPKPARPPPPVIRTNKVAPSFVSVFANPNATASTGHNWSHEHYYNNTSQSQCQNSYSNFEQDQQPPQLPPPLNARRPSSNFNAPMNGGSDTVRDRASGNPPNKPKRKASIYRPGETADQGAYTANYLETTYNHITSLNFETLKLIASQTPAHIKRGVTPIQKFNKASPLRWSQFYVTDVEPLTHGKGFCFYSAFWEDESCLLLVQESLSCGIPPLEFECIASMASFEDIIPPQFISWKPSEFVNTNAGVKVFVSVLPSCTVQTLANYMNSSTVSPSRKYFALLQAMDFWGRDDLNDLIVFHQIPSESDSPISDYSCGSLASKSNHSNQQSLNFGLVYVVSTRLKSGSLFSSQTSRGAFESGISKLLFHNNGYHHLLCDNDQSVLYRRIVAPGIGTHEVEAQLRLFLQLKLFGAQGNDLDKILRYRSDKQVTQWMDKERAFCMKDAIERTLQRNSEPISPLRKSFVEFLMISDSCAKAVLDLIVDLHPDD